MGKQEKREGDGASELNCGPELNYDNVNREMHILFFIVIWDNFSFTKFFRVLSCFINLGLGVFVSQMKFSLSNSKLRPQLFHLNYGRELVIKF